MDGVARVMVKSPSAPMAPMPDILPSLVMSQSEVLTEPVSPLSPRVKAPLKVAEPETMRLVDRVAEPVTVRLLLMVVLPVAAPMDKVVAAPAKLTVVAVVLIKLKVASSVEMVEPLTAKLPPSVVSPVPVVIGPLFVVWIFKV